jgi:hypothetical protein
MAQYLVSIEKIFHCDSPDCKLHGRSHFLTVDDGDGYITHFCSWDCILRYAAKIPPIEVIACTPTATR